MQRARAIQVLKQEGLVIDTESKIIGSGMGQDLSEAAGGHGCHLRHLNR